MIEKLQDIIEYAATNIEYYKRKYSCCNIRDFNMLPCLTKEELIYNVDDFIKSDINKLDLLKENTSGTTGKSLTIYKSYADRIVADLRLWKERRKVDANIFNATIIKFYAYRRVDNELIAESVYRTDNEISFSLFDLSDKALIKYIDIIKNEQRCWFFAAPSAMLHLSKFVIKNNIIFDNILLIELTGEYVTREQENFIQQAFKVPVRNHYGSREFWGLAYECEFGHLHVFDDIYYYCIVDDAKQIKLDNNEWGNLCVTHLNKAVMPLIKYIQGDKAKLNSSFLCPCGNKSPILELAGGRITDFISTPNGDNVSSIILFYFIEVINHVKTNVLMYQFIQKHMSVMEIFLVINFNANKQEVKTKLLQLFEKHLPHIDIINIKFVEQIKFQENYSKLRYFINNCNESVSDEKDGY